MCFSFGFHEVFDASLKQEKTKTAQGSKFSHECGKNDLAATTVKGLQPCLLHSSVRSHKDSLVTTISGVKVCSVLAIPNAFLTKLKVMYEYFCIYVL